MKKIVTFGLLFLVTSMIFSMPAQIYADPGLDSLVRITTQARDHIRFQLSNISEPSSEIKRLYEHGVSETELVISAVEQGDAKTAKTHFLPAMQAFKEVGRLVNEQRTIAQVTLSDSTDTRFGIKPVIDRMERYADRLEAIAEKNQVDIDFTVLDELIITAKQNYNDNNLDEAKRTIEIIESVTLDIYNILKEDANQKKIIRAKGFAEKYIQRITILIEQTKDLDMSENVTKNLEQSQLKLIQASDPKQIAKHTKIIISIKNQVDESKANRINAIINQLETKLITLSSNENIDAVQLDKAKTMFVELKVLISEGNLNDGLKVYRSLKSLIKNIENPIRTDAATIPERKTIESLSDSKSERIKTIIQKLENELKNLEEKAENHRAAQFWIKNSYSLLKQAQSDIDNSPEDALKKISQIEKILERLYKILE